MNLIKSLVNLFLALVLSITYTSLCFAATTPHKVFFKNLKDGAQVTSPLQVEMGIEGMTVAKAGDVKEGEGHHHLIVDGGPVASGAVVGKDDQHIHYGNGQTEASVVLTPGKHTLTLQFADGAHHSYGPDFASTITVNVKG